MTFNNQTSIIEFWLLGLQSINFIKISLFLLFLTIYITILGIHILIITIIIVSQNLKSPMYFFLTHLSWSEILLTLVTMPTILSFLLTNGQTITLLGCITQIYLLASSTLTECFLLAVMSYDRYLAVCYPLRYRTIMDFKHQAFLGTFSWVFALFFTFIVVIQMGQLHFCGPNIIHHFVCDPTPLMALSCSDTSMIKLQIYVLGAPVTLFPLSFIIITYGYIFTTIMKISTTTEGQKAFSTCSSHVTVVSMYFGTLITLYVFPLKGLSSNLTKIQTLLYTVVTPLSNPIIYSLRNNDLKTELKKLLLETLQRTNDICPRSHALIVDHVKSLKLLQIQCVHRY